MRQIIERLSMLQGMRDEMVMQATAAGSVDCASPAFDEIDAAIRCLDEHHIHRLRISLDIGEEIPLAQWLSRRREGLPVLTDYQRDKLLHNAFLEAQAMLEKRKGYVIDPGGACLCSTCGRTVSALEDSCRNCNNKLDWDI